MFFLIIICNDIFYWKGILYKEIYNQCKWIYDILCVNVNYVFKEINDKQKFDKVRYIFIKKIEDYYKRDWELEMIKIR